MPHRLLQVLHLDLKLAFAGDQIIAFILVLTLRKTRFEKKRAKRTKIRFGSPFDKRLLKRKKTKKKNQTRFSLKRREKSAFDCSP